MKEKESPPQRSRTQLCCEAGVLGAAGAAEVFSGLRVSPDLELPDAAF